MNISSTSCSRLELRSSRKANKCKPLNEVSKWRNESVVRNGASVNDGVKSLRISLRIRYTKEQFGSLKILIGTDLKIILLSIKIM